LKIEMSSVVPAPPARVFAALVDPAVLLRAIPGCESLTTVSPGVYEATMRIGVAGLKGTYTGKASVRDERPPSALTLAFDGKGGPGFVRGSAAIALAAEQGDTATRVACDADVQVGGVIAAVGSRLIQAAATKMADDFFRRLSDALRQG
jgi:carbon monoxide dehydrogenase subunit G